MLIHIKENKYRYVRNQHMTRRRRIAIKRNLYFMSLKGKTWLSIGIVVLTTAILITPGWLTRQYEKKTEAIQQSVSIPKAWAAQPTPTMPEEAPEPEKEHNVALIKKIWGKDADVGLAIAKCESGYRTHAHNHNTNGSWDIGIFQINTIHNMEDMENATANVSYAYLMFMQQGANPWTSSQHCWGN